MAKYKNTLQKIIRVICTMNLMPIRTNMTVEECELFSSFDNYIDEYEDDLDMEIDPSPSNTILIGILASGSNNQNDDIKTFPLAKIPLNVFYHKSIIPYVDSYWVPNNHHKHLAIFTFSQMNSQDMKPVDKTNIIRRIQTRFRSVYNKRNHFINGPITKALYNRELKGKYPKSIQLSLLRGLLL
jgi:DNA replication initiation complex subunit (GINS family)